MRNFLDASQCNQFSPSFDNKECEFYQYAEDELWKSMAMNAVSVNVPIATDASQI
jgi:hypothetical protein